VVKEILGETAPEGNFKHSREWRIPLVVEIVALGVVINEMINISTPKKCGKSNHQNRKDARGKRRNAIPVTTMTMTGAVQVLVLVEKKENTKGGIVNGNIAGSVTNAIQVNRPQAALAIGNARNGKNRKNMVNEVTHQKTRKSDQPPVFLPLVSMEYSRKVISLANSGTLKCGFPR
jgi:hypothetical protein